MTSIEVKLKRIEFVTVVFVTDGWHLYDLNMGLILEGPFSEHGDAVERCKTRAWRISQGWAP
jgi:hypothetical protein